MMGHQSERRAQPPRTFTEAKFQVAGDRVRLEM